ncbi:hypothetical protein PSZ91_24210 [Shigella sonnei]|nr:hypothetical protein [Shigella sonnei]
MIEPSSRREEGSIIFFPYLTLFPAGRGHLSFMPDALFPQGRGLNKERR